MLDEPEDEGVRVLFFLLPLGSREEMEGFFFLLSPLCWIEVKEK